MFDKQGNAEQATAYFNDNFNCAQAILCTYCEQFGLDKTVAAQIARGFGAGMGRLQGVCGAVASAVMVLGLKYGNAAGNDIAAREQIYNLVREFTHRFEERNKTIICRELLGVDLLNGDMATNTARFKSLCPKMIRDAVEILETMQELFMTNEEDIKEHIRKQYAKAANKEAQGCCFSECGCNGTAADIAAVSEKLGYTQQDFDNVPFESNMGLGCGNPVAIASLKTGETVLDLGSGGGFDCFIARKHVGETGHIIGIDMTPEMIALARKNAADSGYKNVEFRLGEIEHLPVADNSVDIIISNCVINLSPDKEQVFKEMYRVLKSGGRLSISDVVAVAEIPEIIKQNLYMISSCIGGAERLDKLESLLHKAGFKEIRITPKENSRDIVKPWAPSIKIEDYLVSANIEAQK